MTTGEKIRVARIKAGLTQEELAERLNLPYQSIGQWERGERNASVKTLKRISPVFGIKWEKFLDDDLLGDEEPEQPTVSHADRVDGLILARNSSRRELAILCGIAPSTLQSAMERAKKTDGKMSLDILYPIANHFRLPMWFFLCSTEDFLLVKSAMTLAKYCVGPKRDELKEE